MPWKVVKDDRCPSSKPWGVVKETDGSVEGCHVTQADAQAQQAALYASEGRAMDMGAWDGAAAMSACANSGDPAAAYAAICAGRRDGDPALQSSWALPHHSHPGDAANADGVRNALSRLPQTEGLTNREAAQRHLDAHMADMPESDRPRSIGRPPRDNIVRAVWPGGELRDNSDAMPTMTGHFAVFDQWTSIDSIFEGTFLERIAPGAFRKTFNEGRDRLRVLFQHGEDPMIGDKPLGPIAVLREDETGAYYEVSLLDTSYNRDLLPGLRAGLYGASFRFRVTKEDFEQKPKASAHNPQAIPERTVREAEVMEFGPVTFPAYSGATAGVRSMTDTWIARRDPTRLADLLDAIRATHALPNNGADHGHSDAGSRQAPVTQTRRFSDEEWFQLLKGDPRPL